jgi:hypothetical protein
MKRREFITLLGGSAVWPLAARAQQSDRMRHIAVLMNAAKNPEQQANIEAFLQVLQQLGWVDGRNVRIETRWAGGQAVDIRRQAADLAALAPDVIFATSPIRLGLALSIACRNRGAILPGLCSLNTA